MRENYTECYERKIYISEENVMKIKKIINRFRVWYHSTMMMYYLDLWESAHMIYDESHRNCTRLIEKYDKHEAKLHSIRID